MRGREETTIRLCWVQKLELINSECERELLTCPGARQQPPWGQCQSAGSCMMGKISGRFDLHILSLRLELYDVNEGPHNKYRSKNVFVQLSTREQIQKWVTEQERRWGQEWDRDDFCTSGFGFSPHCLTDKSIQMQQALRDSIQLKLFISTVW